MRSVVPPLLLAFALLAGCGDVFERDVVQVMVNGVGPNDVLKVRADPGLGYHILLGLPDGALLDRHDCVTEMGQFWCKVSLPDAPQVAGYVAADYLSASQAADLLA